MSNQGKASFWFISVLTFLSCAVIVVNMAIGMKIPFRVEFLIGYVGMLFIYIVWHAVQTRGWKLAVLMLLFAYLSAFIAEMLGVNLGLVFGSYHYTDLLGYQVMGVPLLAGLAWGPITYASYQVVELLAPTPNLNGKPWVLNLIHCFLPALMAAFATTAWDLMIDPIAVDGGWWVWHEGGVYFAEYGGGIPLSNFIGWLGVSTFIQLIYRLVFTRVPSMPKDMYFHYGSIVLYCSLFLTALGVCISVLRNWEVAFIGAMAMLPFIGLALIQSSLVRRKSA